MMLIQSLLKPDAYSHSVGAIELIETHISWVILTGQYAYKIKKPVCFDFLDFSTLEKRHFYCEEELRLNRRFAPQLYIQIVPITGTIASPQLNGSGEVIEYAVQMRQFPANQLLSELANHGRLEPEMIDQLADLTADFHSRANKDISNSCYGTATEIHHWFLSNFANIYQLVEDDKFQQQLIRLEKWGEQEVQTHKTLIQQRKQQGFIRECHGDLHLGNMAIFDNQVMPFDGIEFNPALRWIDMIDEIAFVVMDLEQRNLKPFAYRFLNRYLSQSGDYQGVSLLRYYLVYRALVRTKVAMLRWQQHKKPQDLDEAKNYTTLAENFSTPKSPLLLITHGYSGSGKSTFSAELAENFGMIHLRSDVERQRLFSTNCYSAEHTLQTYQKLADLAAILLNAGFSVVVDATFLKFEQRALFQTLAVTQQVRFMILDFQAQEEELTRRIQQRQQSGNDVSEATLDVLQKQIKTAQPLTIREQNHVMPFKNMTDTLEKLFHHL
ncbi:MAG: AAA family ATPase [Methylococcales bacterium]|nr:AAA family ATPase [Methylococcales bacterium]